jgi:hypothetical protein
MIIVIFLLLIVSLILGYEAIDKNLMKPPKNYPNLAAIKPHKRMLICYDAGFIGESFEKSIMPV